MDGLPGDPTRPSRRHFPWGFLGMLAIVWAIEGRLARHDLDFTAIWHWDWRVIGNSATRPERVQDKDILIFGDSVAKFGVIPRVLNEETGKKAYNFALHTGQPSSSYFMLRRTLRAGARPSAIVLDTTPHMLMHNPRINKNLWSDLLTAGECLDLSWTMKDPEFFASTMLGVALPSYKERYDIRANLMAALQGRSTSRRFDIPGFRRNWKLNDGAQLMMDNGIPRVDANEWTSQHYSIWIPDAVATEYLDRFLDLAASHEIPVYWLLAPLHPDVQFLTDANRFDLALSVFVLQAQARHPGTIVVDARHSGFTPDLFLDGAHPNRRGALKLSSGLAQVLRERADGPTSTRWVNMDLGRVREFGGSIEDITQSALALKAEGEASRRR